jgi:putative Mg2+ transporter-C (MgtC) family protein
MSILDLGHTNLVDTAVKMGLAYLLAIPIGWEREQQQQSVGVRTFPIVAMASCGYLLIALQGGSASGDLRALQGLMTGIGFVGGGAILREGASVRGTATAASVWNTGAIGAAVAYGRLEVAVLLSALNLFALHALLPLKRKLDERAENRKSKE